MCSWTRHLNSNSQLQTQLKRTLLLPPHTTACMSTFRSLRLHWQWFRAGMDLRIDLRSSSPGPFTNHMGGWPDDCLAESDWHSSADATCICQSSLSSSIRPCLPLRRLAWLAIMLSASGGPADCVVTSLPIEGGARYSAADAAAF